jgi:hypothetical protein
MMRAWAPRALVAAALCAAKTVSSVAPCVASLHARD